MDFRKNINRLAHHFFGKPRVVSVKVSDIKKIIDGVVHPTTTINAIYTVASRSALWTPLSNSIKHTAEVTGVYRFSVLGVTTFTISTTISRRNPVNGSSGSMVVILEQNEEETFVVEPEGKVLVVL